MHDDQSDTRCHRCGARMTLYVVGDDYCRPCKAEMRDREAADARRVARYPFAKDLGPNRPAA